MNLVRFITITTFVGVLLPGSGTGAQEVVEERLFHIERNINANIVVYSARVMEDGNLAEKDPVGVYWLRLAENGGRKDLSWVERRLAYGFKVASRRENRVVLDMAADVGRHVKVDEYKGGYRAFMRIEGRLALLDRIFIFAEGSGVRTRVKYVELFGTNLRTGERVHEKFDP